MAALTFIDNFLSQVDDDGKTSKILTGLRLKDDRIKNYADFIVSIGMVPRLIDTDDNCYHDILYLLSHDPVISYINEIADGVKSPTYGIINIPRHMLKTLFFKRLEKQNVDDDNMIFRTILPIKCYHSLVSAVVLSYERFGTKGLNNGIKDEDMEKIRSWVDENAPDVKSSVKR